MEESGEVSAEEVGEESRVAVGVSEGDEGNDCADADADAVQRRRRGLKDVPLAHGGAQRLDLYWHKEHVVVVSALLDRALRISRKTREWDLVDCESIPTGAISCVCV